MANSESELAGNTRCRRTQGRFLASSALFLNLQPYTRLSLTISEPLSTRKSLRKSLRMTEREGRPELVFLDHGWPRMKSRMKNQTRKRGCRKGCAEDFHSRILMRVIASEAKQSLFAIAGWPDNPDCFASLAMTHSDRAGWELCNSSNRAPKCRCVRPQTGHSLVGRLPCGSTRTTSRFPAPQCPPRARSRPSWCAERPIPPRR